MLTLDVEGESKGTDLLAVVNASPLGTRFAKELKGLEIGGATNVTFRLNLPFAPDAPSTVKGEIDLIDSPIVAKKWDTDFAHASGKIHFTNEGLRAGPLNLQKAGNPAAFSLWIGDEVADASNVVEARLDSNLPMNVVFKGATVLEPWWPRFTGRSDWSVGVAVPRGDAPTQLTLRSELRGTAIELPAPLDNPPAMRMPVEVRLQLPMEGSPLDVVIADVLRLRARLPDAQREFAGYRRARQYAPRAVTRRGTQCRRARPAARSARWAGIGIGAGAGPSLLRAVDVRADKATIGTREFSDLGLVLARRDRSGRHQLQRRATAGHLADSDRRPAQARDNGAI